MSELHADLGDQDHELVELDTSTIHTRAARDAWLIDYLRGRGDESVPPARPVDQPRLQYLAHRMLDVAGGDIERVYRAIDAAATELAGWGRSATR
jgi:hypothetical protein